MKPFARRGREEMGAKNTAYGTTGESGNIQEAVKKLEEADHYFNGNGKLIDRHTGKPFKFNYHSTQYENQKRYEALGKVVEDYVYALLQDKNGGGLKKVSLPFGSHDRRSGSFIFHSHDLHKKDKILILMHGSGVVRAGQWSRRLIINESIEAGTMIPYIRTAKDFGYGVIVLNTNQRDGYYYNDYSASPEQHFQYVWKNMVEKLYKPVAIVTHSYGGSVVMEATKTIPSFMERTFAVALTDCWVSDSHRLKSWLKQKVCNWVTSHERLGTNLRSNSNCPTVSGGTTVHEETPWKAYKPIWEFITEQDSRFMKEDTSPRTQANSRCFALTGQQTSPPISQTYEVPMKRRASESRDEDASEIKRRIVPKVARKNSGTQADIHATSQRADVNESRKQPNVPKSSSKFTDARNKFENAADNGRNTSGRKLDLPKPPSSTTQRRNSNKFVDARTSNLGRSGSYSNLNDEKTIIRSNSLNTADVNLRRSGSYSDVSKINSTTTKMKRYNSSETLENLRRSNNGKNFDFRGTRDSTKTKPTKSSWEMNPLCKKMNSLFSSVSLTPIADAIKKNKKDNEKKEHSQKSHHGHRVVPPYAISHL